MPITINLLWENKKYWVMVKMTWEQEIDLETITYLYNSHKNNLQKIKNTMWTILNKWIWFLKTKLSKNKEVSELETKPKKKNRKYRNYKDFQKTKNNAYYAKNRTAEKI